MSRNSWNPWRRGLWNWIRGERVTSALSGNHIFTEVTDNNVVNKQNTPIYILIPLLENLKRVATNKYFYITIKITIYILSVYSPFSSLSISSSAISASTLSNHVVVVYTLPLPLLMGGVRCSRLWSTSQLSGQQCNHSGGVCPQIQGDNVVRMWVKLKR